MEFSTVLFLCLPTLEVFTILNFTDEDKKKAFEERKASRKLDQVSVGPKSRTSSVNSDQSDKENGTSSDSGKTHRKYDTKWMPKVSIKQKFLVFFRRDQVREKKPKKVSSIRCVIQQLHTTTTSSSNQKEAQFALCPHSTSF